MNIRTFQSIYEELQLTQSKVQKKFQIKAGNLGDFARLNVSSLNRIIRPALVIMTSRMFNNHSDKVIFLAAVIQYIYLASYVHRRINEDFPDGEKPDPRDDSQFPILVGDYLFGRCFATLCDGGLVQYLHPLAEIIRLINEGGILNKQNPDARTVNLKTFQEIIRLETAELFAGSCRLGAHLAGAGEEQCKNMHYFGLSLGMAVGFLEEGVEGGLANKYLDQANGNLAALAETAQIGELEGVINLFRQREEFMHRLVG
jgi:geranylgeranyl pyrophosphate synthase